VSKGSIIVTGGAGFIGSNFARYAVSSGYQVVNLDALTYAGNLANLSEVDSDPGHQFVNGSITDGRLVRELLASHQPDAVINLAAESHVDRSIDGPKDFIETNIVGVYTLLEAVRDFLDRSETAKREAFRFIHVSTDEVFGSIESGAATEASPYAPSSPYAASKASADHLVRAWHRTYQLPTLVTNCSNNYGPYQFPEKLIPLMILKAVRGEPLPIYGDGGHEREWLHVADHCAALEIILSNGRVGETYNIGSGDIRANRDVVTQICAALDDLRPRTDNRPYSDLISYTDDRPGHDARYALDSTRMRTELSWTSEISFEVGLRQTVAWYLENTDWVESVRSRYDGERLGDPQTER